MNEDHRQQIVVDCIAALLAADLVFAYVNRPDAYGTFVELGVAYALRKYVYLVTEEDTGFEWNDYWFADLLVGFYGGHQSVAPFDANRFPLDQPWLVKDGERDRMTGLLRDAIVEWTARPQLPVPAPTNNLGVQAAQAFRDIAQWTSDPRVRGEAQRMLRALTPGQRA